MAVLQNIRNRAGLLIGIIAFALLAFLVGDLLQNGTIGSPDRAIAEINGEDIDIEEYNARVNSLTEVYKMNSGQVALDTETSELVRDEAWNQMLSEYVLNEEYDDLGISVHKDELFDLVQGSNIHPLVSQVFGNPQTGKVDKSQILNFLKSFEMEGGQERKNYCLFLENELIKQRKNEKFNAIIKNGIGVNSAEAKYVVEASKQEKNLDFFAVSYSTIVDSTVQVSNSEISAYYNKNKENYKQAESRSIEYVIFDIIASTEDDVEVGKWSADIAKEFKDINEISEVVRFAKFNSDEIWDEAYLAESKVEERLKSFAFDSEVGAVYGPYKENDAYKVVKLASRTMRSDSVRASHILIQEATPERSNEVADSLMAILQKNTSKMDVLAKEFSKDPGSAAKGGDLGWFNDGVMVPSFNKASFEGPIGKVQKVESQFGIHLVIVKQKSKPVQKVQLASVVRKVEASNETYRNIYTEASKFRSGSDNAESFKASAEQFGKRIRFGSNVTRESKTIMGLPKSSEIVRWAYNAEKGDVSDVLEMDGIFVIATLSNVVEKGYRPESVVTPIILNEVRKAKKAEMIIADINSKKEDSQTITSLAAKMGEDIKSAVGINFGSYSVASAGVEPELVGAISKAEADVVSAPIAGNRAVYVFKVTEQANNASLNSVALEKVSMEQNRAYMVNYQVFSTLIEAADVVDYRLKF